MKDVLGEFEHQVLLAALRLGDDAYTASIVLELEERIGREVAAAGCAVCCSTFCLRPTAATCSAIWTSCTRRGSGGEGAQPREGGTSARWPVSSCVSGGGA